VRLEGEGKDTFRGAVVVGGKLPGPVLPPLRVVWVDVVHVASVTNFKEFPLIQQKAQALLPGVGQAAYVLVGEQHNQVNIALPELVTAYEQVRLGILLK